MESMSGGLIAFISSLIGLVIGLTAIIAFFQGQKKKIFDKGKEEGAEEVSIGLLKIQVNAAHDKIRALGENCTMKNEVAIQRETEIDASLNSIKDFMARVEASQTELTKEVKSFSDRLLHLEALVNKEK